MTEPACAEPSDKRHDGLKQAKEKAMTKKVRQQTRRIIIPLVMDMVKQSIASPIASNQISSALIYLKR